MSKRRSLKPRHDYYESSSSSSSSEDEQYTVERIINKRENKGYVEYLLKWKNYPTTANSWVRQENLNCPELISDYESKTKKNKQTERESDRNNVTKKRKKTTTHDETESESEYINHSVKSTAVASTSKNRDCGCVNELPNHFRAGRVAEKIVGATDEFNGEISFLIKWKNTDDLDLVSSRVAKKECPDLVFQFYEKRLFWCPSNDSKMERKLLK